MLSASVRPGLCMLLTVWAASTRPLVPGTGSPHPKAWWEAPEFARVRDQANEYRKKGDLPSAEAVFLAGYDEARRQGITAAQIAYLSALGNVRMLRFAYQDALQAYLRARNLAESAGDWVNAGGIAV